MPLEVVQPSNDLDEYLGLLFGEQTGYVYLGTGNPKLDREDKNYWTKHYFKWPEEQALIKPFIKTASIDFNVYIAPALFNSDKTSEKENIKGSQVCWVDFDGKLPNDLKGAPGPSMVVESSDPSNKKQHWYWRLEDFCTDISIIEKVNRGLAYLLDADVSGWDANQVLRPPNSKNHKYGTPQDVILLSLSPWTVNPSSFNTIPEPPSIPVEFNVSDLQDAARIISRYTWPDQAFDLYRTLPENIKHAEGRSGALMQLAYFGAEMGMQDVEIFTILYHADERWKKFKGRPDRVRRLNSLIASARVKHPFNPVFRITSLEIFGFQDFLDTKVEVKWVIQNFLEQSGSFIVSAKPGVGKSRISLQASASMGLGKKFLHYDVLEPHRLIFFSMEMGHAQLLYFLKRQAEHLSKEEIGLLQENLLVVPLGTALYVNRRDGQKLVEDAISKYSPTGYVFDSLSRLSPNSTSDEPDMQAIMDWDAGLRKQTGCFSWFVHHNRKATVGNKKPKDLDDLLGATIIAANATAVYTMWKDKPYDEEVEFINVKQRLGEVERPYLITSESDLTFVERGVLSPESLMNSSPVGLGLGTGSAPDYSLNKGQVGGLGF